MPPKKITPPKAPKISALEKKFVETMKLNGNDGLEWLLQNGARPTLHSYEFAISRKDENRIRLIDEFYAKNGIRNELFKPEVLFTLSPHDDNLGFWKFIYEREATNNARRLLNITKKREILKDKPDFRDPWAGFDLLAMGVRMWNAEGAVDFLLDKGHDPNAKVGETSERMSIHAAHSVNPAMVEKLAAKGGKFDEADQNGDLPIHIACKQSDEVALAVAKVAPRLLGTLNSEGLSPLAILASKDTCSVELVSFIFEHAKPSKDELHKLADICQKSGNQQMTSIIESGLLFAKNPSKAPSHHKQP